MPQFIIPPSNVHNKKIILTKNDEEFHHIFHVMRKKIGDTLNFLSEDNIQYSASIEILEKEKAIFKILNIKTNHKNSKFILYQCIPKSKKMDIIIEKAVELGVEKIVPVLSQNTVVKLNKKDAEKKVKRWQDTAISAVKQSENPSIPKIEMPKNLEDVIQSCFDKNASNLIGWEHGKKPLKSISLKKNINLIIGPEGGFSEFEMKKAAKEGWQHFRLKGNILRVETAPIALISIIKHELGLL